MADERQPTQAMPTEEEREHKPRPTQPTRPHDKIRPKEDDGEFGGFMGHGGQTNMGYEGQPKEDRDGEGDNPNAAADPD
jgi:hypothetical protein